MRRRLRTATDTFQNTSSECSGLPFIDEELLCPAAIGTGLAVVQPGALRHGRQNPRE